MFIYLSESSEDTEEVCAYLAHRCFYSLLVHQYRVLRGDPQRVNQDFSGIDSESLLQSGLRQ